MTPTTWIVLGSLTLTAVGVVMIDIVQTRHANAIRQAEMAQRARERQERLDRWIAWQAHGAHRVGPHRRWWSIPGGNTERRAKS